MGNTVQANPGTANMIPFVKLRLSSLLIVSGLLAVGLPDSDLHAKLFKIRVVDDETGRGVPLVELRTVNNIRYFTDSAGLIAFDEPGLQGMTVFFHVESNGYEYPVDRFGYRGVRLKIEPGGEATLKVKRTSIAQRLYRVTGGGIYRDSMLLGEPVPLSHPVLNAQVFGSDSVVNAVYRGEIYWFWGDTNRPSYPLGNFHVPGAVSQLPSQGGLDPGRGVELDYFVGDQGFAKETAKMEGSGPTWINGLTTITGEGGVEYLYAKYVKVAKPMRVYRQGLARFDDTAKQFKHRIELPMESPIVPGGHPFHLDVEGHDYVYYADPFPVIRVRGTVAALESPETYEAYSCFEPDTDHPAGYRVDRDLDGRLKFRWRTGVPPLLGAARKAAIASGQVRDVESFEFLRDVATGKPIKAHGGSVYWNEYRSRWVMIFLESFGSSFLGELWFAESSQPEGPWVYATKIVTHKKYSFYNPKQHPMFDQQQGRLIYFEGTYTNLFSGNPEMTPRYNYNQIMYQLDLSDPRLVLPVPVYPWVSDLDDTTLAHTFTTRFGVTGRPPGDRPVWFGLDRPVDDSVAIVREDRSATPGRLKALPSSEIEKSHVEVLFYGLPTTVNEIEPESAAATPLIPMYEYFHKGEGRYAYSTSDQLPGPGFERLSSPLCLVWKAPDHLVMPTPTR